MYGLLISNVYYIVETKVNINLFFVYQIPNNIIEKSDQESLEEYLKSEIELLC